MRLKQLVPAVVVAAALGAGLTVATHGAAATGGGAGRTRAAATPSRPPAAIGTGVVDPVVKPYLNPKLLKAVPVGSGDVTEPVKQVLTSPAVTTALDASGIPQVALAAYRRAAAALAASDAACRLPWQLLAAIGRVESDNGQFGGAVLLPDGYGTRPIYGLPLDGRNGVALVRDTDGGKLDGDPNFDRAVGPMQFIPSTWAQYGADGNGDGKKDPNNIFDAALAAAGYLCAGGGDLANPAQEAAAVLRYNDADEYVHVVLTLAASYQQGDLVTVPTVGPAVGGGASTPVTGPAETPVRTASPAPAQTLTPQPTTPQPTTPQPTAPSSPVTAAVPTMSPTATAPAPPAAPQPGRRRQAVPSGLRYRSPPGHSRSARPRTSGGHQPCDRW